MGPRGGGPEGPGRYQLKAHMQNLTAMPARRTLPLVPPFDLPFDLPSLALVAATGLAIGAAIGLMFQVGTALDQQEADHPLPPIPRGPVP